MWFSVSPIRLWRPTRTDMSGPAPVVGSPAAGDDVVQVDAMDPSGREQHSDEMLARLGGKVVVVTVRHHQQVHLRHVIVALRLEEHERERVVDRRADRPTPPGARLHDRLRHQRSQAVGVDLRKEVGEGEERETLRSRHVIPDVVERFFLQQIHRADRRRKET